MRVDGILIVLFRRTDGGRTWEAMTPDVAGAIGRGDTKVQALADLQLQLVSARGTNAISRAE